MHWWWLIHTCILSDNFFAIFYVRAFRFTEILNSHLALGLKLLRLCSHLVEIDELLSSSLRSCHALPRLFYSIQHFLSRAFFCWASTSARHGRISALQLSPHPTSVCQTFSSLTFPVGLLLASLFLLWFFQLDCFLPDFFLCDLSSSDFYRQTYFL